MFKRKKTTMKNPQFGSGFPWPIVPGAYTAYICVTITNAAFK